MDVLEPETSQPKVSWELYDDKRWLHIYAYSHSIVRWKRLLAHLFPGLRYMLAMIEKIHILVCWCLFIYCDQAHKSASKEEAVMIVSILFYEIKNPTKIETLDPSVLGHVQLLLQTRLKVFCSRVFDFDKSEKVNVKPDPTSLYLALMVDRVPESSSYIPPRYRPILSLLKSITRGVLRFPRPAIPVDLPACLLHRSDSSQRCDKSVEVDGCCCGWTYDSIPANLLSFFGYSAGDFARYHQFQSQETGLEGDDIPFDCRYALNLTSNEAGKEDFSVRKRMLVFEEALSVGIYHLLRSIEPLRPVTDIFARSEFHEDQLDHLARDIHPRLFTLLLQSAATLSHDFWISGGGGEVDTESTDELSHRFHAWASERRTVVDNLDIKRLIAVNLLQTVAALFKEPDDDMSSGDNSDSS